MTNNNAVAHSCILYPLNTMLSLFCHLIHTSLRGSRYIRIFINIRQREIDNKNSVTKP